MDFKQKKAEVISLILLIALGLGAIFIYLEHEPVSLELNLAQTSENIAEVEINVEQALLFSMEEFLSGGFSSQSKVWFCDIGYPPNYEGEVEPSLKQIIQRNLESVIALLEQQGFSVERPEVIIHNDPSSRDALKNSPFSIELKDFFISIERDNIKVKEDIGKTYHYDWPVWELYQTMYEWNEEDAGRIESKMYHELFETRPCQAIISACDCVEGDLFAEETKESLHIQPSQVTEVLDEVAQELEDRFTTPSIECKYDIDKINLENQEATHYVYTFDSYLADNEVDILEKNPSKYNYAYGSYFLTYTLPNPSLDSNGGCPAPNASSDAVYREPVSIYNTTPLDAVDFNPSLMTNFGFGRYVQDTKTCFEEENLPLYINQMFAVSKKLSLLLTFSCQDTEHEIEEGVPLAAEVQVRISIGERCPLPHDEDIERASGISCGGGEGDPAQATVCSTNSECGSCEECEISQDLGIGICVPVEEGTVCDTCGRCDNNATCIPAPPQTDDCVGQCESCNGTAIGKEACMPATAANGLYNQSIAGPCIESCYLCDENATCNGLPTPDDLVNKIVDTQFCGACLTCGLLPDNRSAGCVPNPNDDFEVIKGQECKMCENGTIVNVDDGYVDQDDCKRCEVCTGGSCGFDPIHSVKWAIERKCGACKTCGLVGGQAGCIADITEVNRSCGQAGCRACNENGVCAKNENREGTICRNYRGCQAMCDSNGNCRDGSLTNGETCTTIFGSRHTGYECLDNVPGVCQSTGYCVAPSLPFGKKCCGNQICDASAPCCNLGAGQWSCSACDDVTT